jgi:hypothetical protein
MSKPMLTPIDNQLDDSFAAWLAKDPAPDPQMLAEKHGGWSKVPIPAWQRFDRAVAAWKERLRKRHV